MYKEQKYSRQYVFLSSFDWWEVEFQFRVSGRGRVGADGLAFWFSTTKGFGGPVFGSADKWDGLGLFFDSYDNDNNHNNPYILGMINDGTKAYDHQVTKIILLQQNFLVSMSEMNLFVRMMVLLSSWLDACVILEINLFQSEPGLSITRMFSR